MLDRQVKCSMSSLAAAQRSTMAGHAATSLVSNPAENRGPMILVVFWCLTGLSGGLVGLRLYIRIRLRRSRADDWILAFSWLCLLVVAALNHRIVGLGFGKHSLDVPFENVQQIATLGAAGLTVTTIGINAAKISFAVTLLQLTKNLWRWANYLIWFIIITLVVFAVPVAILPWVQCRPLVKTFAEFWPGECVDKGYAVRFGVFQGIWSALMDFALSILPWKILWALQMRPVEKFGIGIAMSLGLVAGVLAILRSQSVKNLSAQDVSYDGAISTLWSTIELSSTMIAACIPVLRTYVKEQVSTLRSAAGTSRNSRRQGGDSTLTPDSVKSTSSSAYRLSRISGKLDEYKKDGQWFAVAGVEGDEEHGYYTRGTGCRAPGDGNDVNHANVIMATDCGQRHPAGLWTETAVDPELGLPRPAHLM